MAYLKAAGTKAKLSAMLSLSDNKHSRIWAPDWGQLAADTGRIHTASVKGQTSAKFNFQNPARGELREVFSAAPGCKLVIADFSQIEIRVIAEITSDPELIRMLQQGIDIYVFVAAGVLGKDPVCGSAPTQVSDTDRQLAKSLTLGLNYGMGPEMFQAQVADQFGLELSLEVVRDMIAKFFRLFEGIAVFHERAEVSAQSATFARTLPLGRRRWLPKELYWNTKRKLLINTPVTGSAADCFKLAVVKVADLLPANAYFVNLLHDEIIVEAQESVASQAAQALEKGMMAAYVELFGTRIPLTVRATVSDRWRKS